MQNFPGSVNNNGVQSLFQGCSLSESVRLENGNFMRTLNLISVPTIGPDLGFYLTYNSRSAATDLGFGYGWIHNWQASITPSRTCSPVKERPEGSLTPNASSLTGMVQRARARR